MNKSLHSFITARCLYVLIILYVCKPGMCQLQIFASNLSLQVYGRYQWSPDFSNFLFFLLFYFFFVDSFIVSNGTFPSSFFPSMPFCLRCQMIYGIDLNDWAAHRVLNIVARSLVCNCSCFSTLVVMVMVMVMNYVHLILICSEWWMVHWMSISW